MRPGDGEILKLVNSMFRPSGCKLLRRNMRCCSSSLWVEDTGGGPGWTCTQGLGGGVKMVHDQKVLSFVMNRAQVLYKAISEPLLGLTDVKEATSGATDAVDHIDGCAGEHVSDVKGLFCALNGSEGE
eukprot:g38178.t1